MANVGYIRVSTTDQNLDRQKDYVDTIPCDHVYADECSGKDINRPELKRMLDFLREGDVLYIESISRLSRSTKDFLKIMEDLQAKGVEVNSKKEQIDTASPTGKFMLTVFSAMYEMERENIRDRQKEGIASAKLRGKHLGRPKMEYPDNWDELMELKKSGAISTAEAQRRSGMARSSFYKLLSVSK